MEVTPPFDLVERSPFPPGATSETERRLDKLSVTDGPDARKKTLLVPLPGVAAGDEAKSKFKVERRHKDTCSSVKKAGGSGGKKEEPPGVRWLRKPARTTLTTQFNVAAGVAAPRSSAKRLATKLHVSPADPVGGNGGEATPRERAATGTSDLGEESATDLTCHFISCATARTTHTTIRCMLLVPETGSSWHVWGACDDGSILVWRAPVCAPQPRPSPSGLLLPTHTPHTQGEYVGIVPHSKHHHGGEPVNALVLVDGRVWSAGENGVIGVWNAKVR